MLVDLNCPVELLEYQLYRSKKTGKVYCSFQFNNISDKRIKGFNATIYCFDQFGEPTGWESNCFEYKFHLTGSIGPNKVFEDNERVSLDNFSHTRKIEMIIEKVLFSDDTTWAKSEAELEKVELKEIHNSRQLTFVKAQEGQLAKYYAQLLNDKWTCICGRLNLENMQTCKRCKKEKSTILSFYSNEKTIDDQIELYEKQIEENQKQEQLEKERQHAVKMKKVKKIFTYSALSLSILLLISIGTFGFITKFTFSWDKYLLLKNKDNALIEAVQNQNMNEINFLIENGANANFVNKDGENSISEAIQLPNKKLAISLMNKGMGKIKVGQEKNTLAHIAANNEQIDILKELHHFKVDMDAKNEMGHSVIYSALETRNQEIMDYLINDIKVNLQDVDNDGNNILQVALLQQLNDTVLFKKLLNLAIDFNSENNQGQNTYEMAILTENKEMVQLFIDKGLNVNQVDKLGNNALHVLLQHKKGNVSFLTELIKKGTDVNGLNGQGQSPLYVAIVNGDQKMVEGLINNKVNIDSVNSNGDSAQDVAEKYNKSFVELFEQGKFVIKYDTKKNVFMVNGIALGNTKKDVVNKLGNPAKRQEFTSVNGEIDCIFYYMKDRNGRNIETQYCTYTGSNTIEEITFDFSPKHLNENWYKDLGKPFVMYDDGDTLFYLEGTEQLLQLKPNEDVGFLHYADANFYYYYPKD